MASSDQFASLDPWSIFLGFVPYKRPLVFFTEGLGVSVGLCFCLRNFSLYFHTVKRKTLCVLFPFLAGVMLHLAKAVQMQPNVARQGGNACPVHGAAAIILAWFGVAADKWKGPMSGITIITACLLLRLLIRTAAVKLCLE